MLTTTHADKPVHAYANSAQPPHAYRPLIVSSFLQIKHQRSFATPPQSLTPVSSCLQISAVHYCTTHFSTTNQIKDIV